MSKNIENGKQKELWWDRLGRTQKNKSLSEGLHVMKTALQSNYPHGCGDFQAILAFPLFFPFLEKTSNNDMTSSFNKIPKNVNTKICYSQGAKLIYHLIDFYFTNLNGQHACTFLDYRTTKSVFYAPAVP